MTGIYKSIKARAEGLYKEKGSKFFAYAVPVTSADMAMDVVDQIRKENPKARHHCFAYRLGNDQLLYRYNDDGEPSGTGGKPILGQIDSFGLSDIVIVVSRYFGGKLLGSAGLALAYKSSAGDALLQAEIVTKELRIRYLVHFSYDIMGTLMDALNRYHAILELQEFYDRPHLVFSLPLKHPPFLLDQIIAHALGLYPEEIGGRRQFEQLSFDELPR